MLKDKLSYVIKFGIVLCIKDMLIENVKQSNFFPFEVSVCYLNSKFQGHAAALDIIHKFNEGVKELSKGQFLQISMDGPSVNWAFLKEIQKHHEQEELPQSFMGHFKQVQLLHAGILKVLLKLYTSHYMIVLHVVQIILVSQEVRYFHSRFVLQGG